MTPTLSDAKRGQLRVQAITYAVAGVGVAAFLTLHLGPRAAAERAAHAVAPAAQTAASIVAAAASTASTATTAPGDSATAAPPAAGQALGNEPVGTGAPPPSAPPASNEVPSPPPAPTVAPAPPAPPAAEAPPAMVVVTRFSTGSAELTRPQLEQVQLAAKRLLDAPRLRALVRGHADRRGSNIENTPLSQARAAAVGLALEASGVAAERIEVVGEGSDKPLDAAENVVAFARNRRVEIVFSWKEAP